MAQPNRMSSSEEVKDKHSPSVQTTALNRFVALALERKNLSPEALERGRRAAQSEGKRLDRVLNQLGLINDDQFASLWSQISDLPIAAPEDYPDQLPLPDVLRPAFLRQANVLPIAADERHVLIAVLDPLDAFAPPMIAARTGLEVVRRVCRPAEFAQALDRLCPAAMARAETGDEQDIGHLAHDVERLRETGSDAPVIRLVQSIIEKAALDRASDIHFTVNEHGPQLRFRVDGLLRSEIAPPATLYLAAISRIKILSGLDISEKRIPQDGSFRVVIHGREIDIRASTMPHLHGEGVVLRLLDRSAVRLDLEQLGASPAFIAKLAAAVGQPNGLILMTGPTGSGKTTTLYAALKSIQRDDRNIVTIEDPVEYSLPNITQIEVNARANLTFPIALRSILRQDPDVILIGEIRDQETAQIATRAAMTGHLVLASIHTNSATEAFARLIDMGVEPYLVASTVRASIAQRLVRKLCPACKEETTIAADRLHAFGVACDEPTIDAFDAVGCQECRGAGYVGRTVITEFIVMTPKLRAALLDRAPIIDAVQSTHGSIAMQQDAFEKITVGVTDIAEVERVLSVV